MPTLLTTLSTLLSLPPLLAAPRPDTPLLLLLRSLRLLATTPTALILALHLRLLPLTPPHIGLFLTTTLLSDAALTLVLTLCADSLGRRRVLLVGAGGMVLAGATFALASNVWALLAAAVVGVLSVGGGEVGVFRAVEESAVAGLVGEGGAAEVLGWYTAVGTVGAGIGAALGGWAVGVWTRWWGEREAYRAVFWGYAVVGCVKAGVVGGLSERCEVRGEKRRRAGEEEAEGLMGEEGEERPVEERERPKMGFARLTARTRWMTLKLCALLALDSLASGMVPYSLVSLYLDAKFALPASTLGAIMAATWVLSSVANVVAAALARRIGLINTMVFTHLPSAVFLALVPAPNALWMTAVLLVARGALASMDQAPRSAFLAKVVGPEERTAVMGIVNVVKTLSSSGGPAITGVLAGGNRFWIAFVVAGGLKVVYNIALLAMFLKVEREADGAIHLSRRDSQDSTGRLVDEFELDTDEEDSEGSQSAGDKRRDSTDLRV